MEKYVSIKVVNYGMNNPMNHAYIYVEENKKPTVCTFVSYKEGIRELAKLAHLLHKAPKQEINWFDPAISYRSLQGFVTE